MLLYTHSLLFFLFYVFYVTLFLLHCIVVCCIFNLVLESLYRIHRIVQMEIGPISLVLHCFSFSLAQADYK